MADLKKFISGFACDERGASLVEYTILIGIISVAAIASIGFVGGWVGDQWQALQDALTP